MTDPSLFTVTVTVIASYSLDVAGHNKIGAEAIAKGVICEDIDLSREGIEVLARELEATAEPDPSGTAECQDYVVDGRYEVDFEIAVPARNPGEAQRHAQRLYRENCGPYEFTFEDRTTGWRTREVKS